MKIEIDLQDVLQNEFGSMESFGESIQRQVVNTLQEGIKKQVNCEISRVIHEQIEQAIAVQMPTIINDLLNMEYVKVDKWGSVCDKPTTFRKELVDTIVGELVYNKKSYQTEQSVFTNAVDDVVRAKVAEFKKEYNSLVDKMFCQECFDYAVSKMKQKLGLK